MSVFEHPGGLHARGQIALAQARIAAHEQPWASAAAALLVQARESLAQAPQAVADFNVPGFYKDAEGHRKAMGRLSADAWAAYSCALAYHLAPGHDRTAFADKAIEVLAAWATTNKQTSNADGDLAMADAGTGLVFAAELMTGYDGWQAAQRSMFRQWLKAVYLPACARIAGRSNNWGDWGILGCSASHYYLDDPVALDADIAQMRAKIDSAIAPDGSLPLETSRGGNGIWYTYFALAPLTAACQIAAHARQVDLFHYTGKNGVGLEQALDYLLTYCREPDTWPHYRKADLNRPTPGQWPGNLFEAMSGIYGKDAYAAWVREAQPITVFGHHYAWAVPTLLRTVRVPCVPA